MQWDIGVYNQERQLALGVEVKSKMGVARAWAVQFRRNLLAHDPFRLPSYFLMAFPDRFYLWKEGNGSSDNLEPAYEIDAKPYLQAYFDRAGVDNTQLSHESLELVVGAWLAGIINFSQSSNNMDERLKWLFDSGLYKAIAGGNIQYEVAA